MAVVLGFVAVVRAEPLDLKQVSADAKWAAHLDVDALHASSLFQKAREQMLKEHPEAEGHLAMFREVWKFDPAKDLHGITIYGRQVKKDTGVAIVHAKVDQNLLLEKAKQAPDHQVSTYGKYELHSWIHAKGSKHERSMTGAFYKPDVMVFGGSAEEVMAALDVLDGTKPNFAGKEPSLGGSIPQGAILVAGVDRSGRCRSALQVSAGQAGRFAGAGHRREPGPGFRRRQTDGETGRRCPADEDRRGRRPGPGRARAQRRRRRDQADRRRQGGGRRQDGQPGMAVRRSTRSGPSCRRHCQGQGDAQGLGVTTESRRLSLGKVGVLPLAEEVVRHVA